MKLLTRIGCGLGRSGGLISFINRERSPVPRFQQTLRSSIHVLPIPPTSRRHSMVTTVTRSRRKERETSGQPPAPAPAADDTRWTLLERWCCATNSTAVDVVANIDAKTVAETHTSRGGPLRVSLSRAAAPGVSFLCFDDWAGRHGTRNNDDGGFTHAVVAGHGDSVLLGFGGDYFVYKLAAGQPPSLSLLPACHDPMYDWDTERGELNDFDCDPGEVCRTERALDYMDTGLLRCGGGGGEFLVAQLQLAYKAPFDTAELCVLRPGRRDWEFREAVSIVHHDGGGRHDLGRWQALNAAVPAGNRFLCWVSYAHSTLLVCDMAEAAEENTRLRYVPLPVKAVPPPSNENEWDDDDDDYEDQLHWLYYRTIGAAPPPGTGADAPAAVRFVSIDRRCCCGAPVIRSACEHSGDAFTVTTWTLALTTTTTTATGEDEDEPMTWMKEGVLDCEEFWALLAGYTNEDLPRRAWPASPVVSSEKPDVVCFLVDEVDMDGETKGKKTWMLEVDMRRKTLISVVPCPPHPVRCVNYGNFLPVKLHS